MDLYDINALRDNHAGSLLRAQSAPMAIFLLYESVHGAQPGDIGRQELIDHLDDVLFGLRDVYGEDKYPRPASEYLDDWTAPDRAWLRKYYVRGQDEPRYDLTPAAEDVVRWVEPARQGLRGHQARPSGWSRSSSAGTGRRSDLRLDETEVRNFWTR